MRTRPRRWYRYAPLFTCFPALTCPTGGRMGRVQWISSSRARRCAPRASIRSRRYYKPRQCSSDQRHLKTPRSNRLSRRSRRALRASSRVINTSYVRYVPPGGTPLHPSPLLPTFPLSAYLVLMIPRSTTSTATSCRKPYQSPPVDEQRQSARLRMTAGVLSVRWWRRRRARL